MLLYLRDYRTNPRVQTIAVREAKRTNALYRPHGLRALGQIAQARQMNLMPEALGIVPPIVEELIEEEGDQMEVDSGNGRDSANTLAACVQCLLQCLNPATAESGEGQFQSREILPLHP